MKVIYSHTFPDGQLYIGCGDKKRPFELNPSNRNNLWQEAFKRFGPPAVAILQTAETKTGGLLIERQEIAEALKRGERLLNSGRRHATRKNSTRMRSPVPTLTKTVTIRVRVEDVDDFYRMARGWMKKRGYYMRTVPV